VPKDIAFDDPSKTVVRHLRAAVYRVVRAPIGPKPIGAVVELDLEDGFQRHTYCLLDDLVPQTGDSKLAHFAVRLGNFHPS
jgi:hypothetical protein